MVREIERRGDNAIDALSSAVLKLNFINVVELSSAILAFVKQLTTELVVKSLGPGMIEITDRVVAWVRSTQVSIGLLTLHVTHTSASLLIQENADPEVPRDFERFLRRLVPEGDPLFRHTAEGPDDMPAHVRAALTATTLSIPVVDGALALGTWQGIYLYEHRANPHTRKVAAHIIGE